MKADIEGFSGHIKRDLAEGKFNLKDTDYCRTGGRGNGCPFFRLNKSSTWICTLYHLLPRFSDQSKRYKRVYNCLKNKKPPKNKQFSIHYTTSHICEVTATSQEEAQTIFNKNYADSIEKIVEGKTVDYENLI
jgi:hypothetical protein